MAPDPDNRPAASELDYAKPHHSAVLVLLSLQSPPALLYTLRNESLNNHGGQISFPGGRLEPGESPDQAAIREASEEVGIYPEYYSLSGCLSPLYVPPSDFLIHPWLAFSSERPNITLQRSEVSEAFWVSIEDLADPANIKKRIETIHGQKLAFPYWDVHSVPLWGATAMITSEVIAIYREFKRANQPGWSTS